MATTRSRQRDHRTDSPTDAEVADARVTLRPLATPLSLGFLVLAVASFTMSGWELGWVNQPANRATVGLLALCFVAPLQLTSAIFGFLARDSVASTGMGLLTGIWLALGATTFTGPGGTPSGSVGLLLIAGGVALVVPAAASAPSKLVASLVLGLAAFRFAITGGYDLTGGPDWQLAAGAAGLLLATVALYAGLAFEVESVAGRTVLPTGRRGAGKVSLAGTFADEVATVHNEPGVRLRL